MLKRNNFVHFIVTEFCLPLQDNCITMTAFWDVPCSLVKFSNVSEVLTVSIVMVMEAVSTSETLVNI
jgi:hypothetical protein